MACMHRTGHDGEGVDGAQERLFDCVRCVAGLGQAQREPLCECTASLPIRFASLGSRLECTASLPISFALLLKDCLAHILLFVPPCCMRRAACVDKHLRSAVMDERARRVEEFPWRGGATEAERASIDSGLGCNMLCCAPDGSRLVGTGSTASSREVTVYDDVLSVKGVLQGHSTRVSSVATDGKHHATGHLNGNIQVWDAATIMLVGDLQHGSRQVLGLAVRADVLISGSMEGTAKYYSIASRECRATMQHGRHNSVNSVDVDESVVATASDDTTARLWAHSSTRSAHVLQHAAEVNAVSLACSRCRSRGTDCRRAAEVVVTGCYDKLVRLFTVSNGQLIRTLRGHGCEVLAVCATDGLIVSGAGDKTVRVWSMEEEVVAVLEGHSANVQGVALAPGGGLVTSMSDKEVLTWQPVTKSLRWRGLGSEPATTEKVYWAWGLCGRH